jgi:hypothetical protein
VSALTSQSSQPLERVRLLHGSEALAREALLKRLLLASIIKHKDLYHTRLLHTGMPHHDGLGALGAWSACACSSTNCMRTCKLVAATR